MVAAKALPPLVDLMFTSERFVADGATGRKVIFVAALVARLGVVYVEAGFGNGLVTDRTAKMFWMPISVERVEIVTLNRLGTAFAEPREWHRVGFHVRC